MNAVDRVTRCGPTTLVWGRKTYIMGIVNVTLDSFSGDGRIDAPAAIARGIQLAEDGADIIDVGGASSRPGSIPIGPDDEIRRVTPVIRGLTERLGIPISIDTFRAEVADAALHAGASIVNDIWGFHRDPDLAQVVASHGAAAVAMHNRDANADQREGLGGYFPHVAYDDLMREIADSLLGSVAILEKRRVARGQIVIDPGIGFGKTPEQNLEVLRRLGELRRLGFPLLVGTSRKSVIGFVLSLPPEDRVDGTAATVALAIGSGADIVRVHDLPSMARVARMADAIVRVWPPPLTVEG